MLKQMLVCLLVSLISTAECCSPSRKSNKTGDIPVSKIGTTDVQMQQTRLKQPLNPGNEQSENKVPSDAKKSTYTIPVSGNLIEVKSNDMISNDEDVQTTEFNHTDHRPDETTKEINSNDKDHAGGANRGSPKSRRQHQGLLLRRANSTPTGTATFREDLQFGRAQSADFQYDNNSDVDELNFKTLDNEVENKKKDSSAPKGKKKRSFWKRVGQLF